MNRVEIEQKVAECIERVATEQGIALPKLEPRHLVVDDLGFKSLDVATLTALLELTFGVDPFATGQAVVTEIRCVRDVCDLYERCLNGAAPAAPAGVDGAQDERMRRRMAKRSA